LTNPREIRRRGTSSRSPQRPQRDPAGALLIKQHDEWLVSRRYLCEESLALVLGDHDVNEEMVPAKPIAA